MKFKSRVLPIKIHVSIYKINILRLYINSDRENYVWNS